ncbi:MAG: hypothetical protein WAM82_19385 [Thermoanaerobaculia bacterium]
MEQSLKVPGKSGDFLRDGRQFAGISCKIRKILRDTLAAGGNQTPTASNIENGRFGLDGVAIQPWKPRNIAGAEKSTRSGLSWEREGCVRERSR